jgi:hypothetical protein
MRAEPRVQAQHRLGQVGPDPDSVAQDEVAGVAGLVRYEREHAAASAKRPGDPLARAVTRRPFGMDLFPFSRTDGGASPASL